MTAPGAGPGRAAGGARVRAVLFDWGGTLTPWHDVDVREKWRLLARQVDPERVEEIADALFDAEGALWEQCFREHRSATLDELFGRAGVSPGEAALAAYFDAWSPHTFTDPDVPPLFTALRDRGIRIGVLSNTMWSREWHERVFARDGVLDLIDGAVYTSEIPWTKPHPEDRPFDDVYGAKRAGMRAILIPHSRVPPHEVQPDATVHRLAEVLTIVDAWT
jgi:putative hydrolase of the HAD superfamily